MLREVSFSTAVRITQAFTHSRKLAAEGAARSKSTSVSNGVMRYGVDVVASPKLATVCSVERMCW